MNDNGPFYFVSEIVGLGREIPDIKKPLSSCIIVTDEIRPRELQGKGWTD
ncbi:MAG: hypothetical protein M0P58_09085 [Bacteroidales bacterium]|jgi:hypothetical protein|nr:hypothetical protein [Bacteroidales bacterium]